jgi:hypothetical protein
MIWYDSTRIGTRHNYGRSMHICWIVIVQVLVPVMPVFIVVFARCTLARTELEIRYGGMALNNVFHDSSGGNDVVMYYK